MIAVNADGLAAEDTARTAAGARYRGRRKIVGEAAFLLFGGRVEQPEQEKKRHHGGHEIGVSDFPGAAMMSMAALFHLLDYNRLNEQISH